MAQMQNAQTVALQLEKVRDKLPLLYERDDILLTMIQQRGDVEKVSSRNMRLPLQVRPGGKSGQFNPDGGDMGRGSGTSYDIAQVTPLFFRHATEITKLVEYAGNSDEKAIENAAKREVAQAMAQFRVFLDQLMQTAGNGVLGTVSSISGTTITLSVPFGAALFADDQPVQFYDATLTTNRNVAAGVGDSNIVATPDTTANKITVDQVPAGVVATDVVVASGLFGANPASLFGIPYHQSNATTGIWLNLNRATYPVLLATPSVNAGGALTLAQIRTAFNKIRKALGAKLRNAKLVAHTYIGQQQAYEALAIAVMSIIKEGFGQGTKKFDGLYDIDQLTMDGVKMVSTIHADQTRIDFLDLSHWGRAVMQDIDYYSLPGGEIMFPLYGASGGIAAAYEFYFVTGFQVWNDSPRSGSYIYGLTVPTGI